MKAHLKTFTALAAGALALTAIAAGPAAAKPNASPHFIPDSFSLSYDSVDNAVIYLNYKVAGLGNGGSGVVRARGQVTLGAECIKGNGQTIQSFLDHQVNVNIHDVYADKYGNYTGHDALRPNAICPKGAYWDGTFLIQPTWSALDVTLWNKTQTVQYDYHLYA